MCIGAILIAIFGAIGEPAHNLNQLLALLRRRQFIIWMVCTGIVVIAIIAVAKLSKYLRPWAKHHPRMRFFRGMAYGAVSGILSAHTLLVAKSAVELVVRTIAGENQFTRWEFWVIIIGLVGFGLSQLFYMHRGLKLCSTSVLYPFMFCVYNIVAIIDGLIYFNQLDRLSLSHSLLVSYLSTLPAHKANRRKIALGTVILLLGVFALSWRLNSDPVSRQPVSQNPLTPGLGIIDDERTDKDGSVTPNHDEESALLDKESPNPNCELRTPLSTNSHILNITRLRRKGMTESEEIWRELEDDSPSPMTPFTQHRRSSLRSTSSPSTKRNSRFDLPDLDEDGQEDPSERSGLFTRSGTGRTYRTLHHGRRRSTPGSEARRRRSASSSQAALGGWWKMKWWKGGKGEKAKDKGKGKESDGPRSNDGGPDEERGEGGSNI